MGVVRALVEADSLAALEEIGFGRLALVTPAGPYAVPMLLAVDNRSLIFYSTPGRKLDALRGHPRGVSIEIDDVGQRPDWRSVMVVGQFSEAPDARDRLRQALAAGRHRYASQALLDLDGPDTIIGRLSIDQISGRTMLP